MNKIDKLSEQGIYRNSKTIKLGNISYKMRDALIIAPLITGLNLYLIGETGEGKTQLANEMARYFGKKQVCYMEGRPDFDPNELLKSVNLGKLKKAKSDKELVELTENINKMFYYVDELNRCPPIVMNYFFNFFDGKLVHNGEILKLGKSDYSLGFASGNIGDGSYVGVSDTDRALKDRMHMIVKLDDPKFSTTEEDDYYIFNNAKGPRVKLPDTTGECLDDILESHKEFNQNEVPLILSVLGVYFNKGLDYLENTKRHSKRAIIDVWPNSRNLREDTDENKILPLSKRAVLSSIALTSALEMIAKNNNCKVEDTTNLFLDALELTIPYSGVLSKNYVNLECDGDTYLAFENIMEKIKEDTKNKKKDLETAIAYAQFGELEEDSLNKICPLNKEGKWKPVRNVIESIAKNPSLEKKTFEDLKKEYKRLI